MYKSKRCTIEIVESGLCINLKVHLGSIQCIKCEIRKLDWRITIYESQALPKVVDSVEGRTFNVSGGDQSGPQDQKEHHESSDLGGWCSHFCAYCEGLCDDRHYLYLRWLQSVVCRIFLSERISVLPDRPAITNGKLCGRPPSRLPVFRARLCDSYRMAEYDLVLICMLGSWTLMSILWWLCVQAFKLTQQVLCGTSDRLPDLHSWRGQLQLCFQVDLKVAKPDIQAYSSAHRVWLRSQAFMVQFHPQCILLFTIVVHRWL